MLTGKPVVPVALNGTFSLMSRDAVDTGGSKSLDDRLVTVQIGKPIYPNPDLEEPEAVTDLRDRCRAAIVEMLTEANSPAVVAESAQPL